MILQDTQLIILNYKRLDNVLRIAYAFQGFMPILVVNNGNSTKLEVSKVLFHNNEENKWCIDRWYWANKSKFKYSIILDDDILPTKHCLLKLRKTVGKYPTSLISIYGKNNLEDAKSYEELKDVWCVDKDVDIAVGSCVAVNNDSLRVIFDDYVKPWGIIKRGDDILVSLSMSHFYKTKHKTISTEVTLLPEKDVGLNTHKNHEELRWKVVEDFKNTYVL